MSSEHNIPRASQQTEVRVWKAISSAFIIMSILLAASLLYYFNGLGVRHTNLKSEGQRLYNQRLVPQNLDFQNNKYLSPQIRHDLMNQSQGNGSTLPSGNYIAWRSLYIGTTLETYYDYVRADSYGSSLGSIDEGDWRTFPNYYDVSVSFAADLASHDIGDCRWPAMETASGYYNSTGEYSYQTSSRIMELAMSMAGISSSDSDVTKIGKVLAFINSNIHYENRIFDHMWFPCETLTFHSGDCSSFSILAAAMFEKAGIETAIAFFSNSTIGHHSMVLIHLEDLGPYRFWYYKDLTSYGLAKGKWIIIEPQCKSLEAQEIKLNWIAYWDLIACSEVPGGP